MRYEPKYDIGQHVFTIYETALHRQVKCSTCQESGSVTVQGEVFICPKCMGRSKHKQYAGQKWFVGDIYNEGGVSKIEITHAVGVHKCHDEPEIIVKYMLKNVCSVHREENVLASREEAQAECDRRNAGGSWEDEA